MAAKKIITLGNDTLREKSKDVENIDKKVLNLIKSLKNTMRIKKGLGLAAVQIGVLQKVIAVNKDEDDVVILINPKIETSSFSRESMDEGCLSIPGVYAPVQRSKKITISSIDIDGKDVVFDAEGLFSRIIQHEIDHINGKLFVDYLNDSEMILIKEELEKIKAANKKK